MYCHQVNDTTSDDVLLPPSKKYSICYNLKKMIAKSMSSAGEIRKEAVELKQISKTIQKVIVIIILRMWKMYIRLAILV